MSTFDLPTLESFIAQRDKAPPLKDARRAQFRSCIDEKYFTEGAKALSLMDQRTLQFNTLEGIENDERAENLPHIEHHLELARVHLACTIAHMKSPPQPYRSFLETLTTALGEVCTTTCFADTHTRRQTDIIHGKATHEIQRMHILGTLWRNEVRTLKENCDPSEISRKQTLNQFLTQLFRTACLESFDTTHPHQIFALRTEGYIVTPGEPRIDSSKTDLLPKEHNTIVLERK